MLIATAGLVGFVHSLIPAHWFPLLLVSRARRWNVQQVAMGAFVASIGHILTSVGIALLIIFFNHTFLQEYAEHIEHYSGLAIAFFGLLYALQAFFFHRSCHGHEHHGPDAPKEAVNPYPFLFSIGLAPCVAELPIMIAIAPYGASSLFLSIVVFSLGVFLAFFTASIISLKSIINRLDHPWLEHYGDVITGLGMVIVGVLFFFFGHDGHGH